MQFVTVKNSLYFGDNLADITLGLLLGLGEVWALLDLLLLFSVLGTTEKPSRGQRIEKFWNNGNH